MLQQKSLNSLYLYYLLKQPLLTKSCTTASLVALNEIISTILAGDMRKLTVFTGSSKVSVKHPFSRKVLLMALYGCLINAPLSHYGYNVLNKVFKAPLGPTKRLAQILVSLMTMTPLMSTLMVSYVSLVNSQKLSLEKVYANYRATGLASLKKSFAAASEQVSAALHNNLIKVVKSSLVTSPVAMAVAQNYVPPQLWVVFFNFIYFVLGTYQNTMVKRTLKQGKVNA